MKRNTNGRKDVFLCHAREDKDHVVKPLASALAKEGISYWLDEAEIAWGDSIVQKVNTGLQISRYVIVVLSDFFLKKKWPARELFAALNIEASSGEVVVLPLLVGSEDICKKIIDAYPIINDKRYIPWAEGIDRIVSELRRRLNIPSIKSLTPDIVSSDKPIGIPLPKVKKKFTQLDKDQFLKKAFEGIKLYFKTAVDELNEQHHDLHADFMEIGQYKFICKIYLHGAISNSCKIWLGGLSASNSIAYSEGNYINMENDSSMNDWITVEEDGISLGLRVSGMWFGAASSEKKSILTPEEAGEYYWRRLLQNFL